MWFKFSVIDEASGGSTQIYSKHDWNEATWWPSQSWKPSTILTSCKLWFSRNRERQHPMEYEQTAIETNPIVKNKISFVASCEDLHGPFFKIMIQFNFCTVLTIRPSKKNFLFSVLARFFFGGRLLFSFLFLFENCVFLCVFYLFFFPPKNSLFFREKRPFWNKQKN